MTLLKELHPIVAQLSPSEEQVPAVVVRGQDVAVTAGAGAGKTRTLVARYLSLLVDGLPLRSIVAITFTKKAAREMRNRVREEVRRYLETPALAAAELSLWRDVYEQLDAARIGTIHGLCAELLRHHPVEAGSGEFGLDPRFDMLDEGQMALLRAQSVDASLAWAADDAETAHLFADFGARALGTIVARLLSQRLDVADSRAKLAGAQGDLWTTWLPHLVGPLRAFLDDPEVRAGFADMLAWRADGTLARAETAGDALVPGFRALLAHWDAIEAARACADAARAVGTRDDWGTISRHLAPLRDNLKQKGAKRNWAPADPKPVIKALQVCYDAQVLPLVGGGIDLDLDRRSAQVVVPALLRIFDRALAVYTSAKQARRALDFDDLEAMALQLLQEHPDVRVYWQGRVQALLVDEFQDTNGRQRDLLKALNGDAGKLFIVGDGKQSIYRFRGADVRVFREERQAIAGRGSALELATSYRAHAELVASLNTLLRPILGDQEDPDRPYIEPFAALQHHRTAPAAGLEPPYTELHLAVGSTSDGAPLRAARVLAARFADLVAHGDVMVQDRDGETGRSVVRPLNYGDIAILCRASGSFAAYEDALELAGIPYLTISGRGFYDRPEVRDLLNALQALADPTDDLALAGLLRSPVCGLSDMALYRLRLAQRSRLAASMWAVLLQDDLICLEGEAARAIESRDLIARLHASVGR
ncbi:MAG: UvrD-helicase domain-containing protein, partial [Anaerolineae bacterium]|nr:UvrD-helicase domain-containing protein [Anaerolineae bacterium]